MPNMPLLHDAAAFADSYLPPDLIHREGEMKRLRKALAPMRRRKPVKHLWLHGHPGTGKTATARFLLEGLRQVGIRGAYINCWEAGTMYAILDRLVRDFRILGAERLSTTYRMERFVQFLGTKPFLLVLDEIDKPTAKERDSIAYSFGSVPNIVLLSISNSRHGYYELDSRVRSRFRPTLVEFGPYSSAGLFDILQRRVDLGLRPDATTKALLKRIATLANGDARIAIQTLRHAAVRAEETGSGAIQPDHLSGGHLKAREAKRKYCLAKFSEHHRLLFQIIRERTEIRSDDLWREYRDRCREERWQSVASRTFSLYLKQLLEAGMIIYRRVLGVRGNIRIYWVLD